MDTCAKDDHAEFGVLFVSGIGQQRPGDAVAIFGSALYRWLFHWNCAEMLSPASPVLSDTVLTSDPDGDGGPAHAVLSVSLPLSSGEKPARWLLAESAWADAASPPRFLDLAHWIWKVSTCLLVLQFVIPMRRHAEQAKRECHRPWHQRLAAGTLVVVYAGLMAVAAMLSVVLSALLVALGIAALLPIPRIDRAVKCVVVRLSAVLGDSYLLAHCPMQLSAMHARVACDLDWLHKRCDRIAIVAHSQGAAIAHHVLKNGNRPSGLRAFITLGQGITKLNLLRRMDWDPQARTAAHGSRVLVVTGLALAGLPVLSVIARRWTDSAILQAIATGPGNAILIAGGLTLIGAGIAWAMRAISDKVEKELVLPDCEPKFVWSDYYASADPVSNGPVTISARKGTGEAGGGLRPKPCTEVYNSASLIADHNGYLRNQDQFLSGLLNDLVAAAYSNDKDPIPSFPLVPESALCRARRRRKWLVGCLVAARVLMIGFAIMVWLSTPARALKGPVNQIVHHVNSHLSMSDRLAQLVAAALITAAVYYVAVVPLWRIADTLVIQRFYKQRHGMKVRPQARSPEAVTPAAEQSTPAGVS